MSQHLPPVQPDPSVTAPTPPPLDTPARPTPLIDLARLKACLGPMAGRFDVDALAECDSTNLELARRPQAPSGTVVVADAQTAGRGRRGRTWLSRPGASLTFSLLWRFAGEAGRPERLSGLPLAVGLAVARAVETLAIPGVCLKWPNDLLLELPGDGSLAKLGGILVETSLERGGASAIIGIGLNLDAPPDPGQPAASLAMACAAAALPPPDRHTVLAALLGELAGVLDTFAREGFAALRPHWEARHAYQRQRVCLTGDHSRQEGLCLGVDDSGALTLETGAGPERHLVGDLSLRPVAPSRHGPLLILDAGNSRLKWGLRENGHWLAYGAWPWREAGDALAEVLRKHPAIASALGCKVAGDAQIAPIQALLDRANIPLRWLSPSAHAHGVRNRYQQPERLGADRWAALIGAWHRERRACLVVCAGTATTVDVLEAGPGEGVFAGGMILPGYALMRRALGQGTAQLPGEGGHYTPLPRLTEDAIATGCLAAQAGAIERMARQLPPGSPVLLAGGDADRLAPLLDHLPAVLAHGLVLDGLAHVAEATHTAASPPGHAAPPARPA
ncbi:biotin--[acetyl-CoA-carboxylase] ligase [Oryzomicrobium sp.]|uniref:biotin--[acetyl-CoA-carboxylase] ligase n=1 Tax=Oryzomicrobium sp. TaxID=1911578 RepID=UPI0025E08F78|nr:biotin--[acetyl-CoA-carboxylase] ligase [Oryzomicrobium sp.]MCE1243635.1 biotin--[acetyl-CoA-carboxylase] ligase [Oryzomicrobium sp.]